MLENMRLRQLPPNSRKRYIRELNRAAGFPCCLLLPANRYGSPIPYSRRAELRSSR
jgi:hypothetical protein